ncbi:hypothetical protein BH10BAC4_BH10BAC4_11190 [soil metagenome]
MFRIVAFIFLILIGSISAFAQEVEMTLDSAKVANDSLVTLKNGKVVNIKSYSARFNPRKALLYSAILPGAGQVYNKKYWKVPLVYGGFVILGSFAAAYNSLYNKYRHELIGVVADPNFPTSKGYTEAQLRTVVDTYRRQRDFFIIINGFWYLLQLVDAHVDAHLKDFDLNPQLKLSLRPDVQQNGLTGRTNGFAITLTF